MSVIDLADRFDSEHRTDLIRFGKLMTKQEPFPYTYIVFLKLLDYWQLKYY